MIDTHNGTLYKENMGKMYNAVNHGLPSPLTRKNKNAPLEL